MIYRETRLRNVLLVEPERQCDERGFFARTYCTKEFARYGLIPLIAQSSAAFNSRAGTVRGMHFQVPPHEEVKLVRVTRGAIRDVVIDLRPDSPTYRQWEAFELTEETGVALYIPKGFAHGYQTLTADTEVFYQMSTFYVPGAASGYRYDDPAFGIEWLLPVSVISQKDKEWPDFAA
jgi:dTDP-4-dehydrorhamnose 3,5-epimerase